MLRVLKTAVYGDTLFLVPIVIFIAIIGRALQITNKLAILIAGLLSIDKIIGIEEGKVVIFLPGAPDPWSGSVCIVTEDRVTPLDLTVKSQVELMRRHGMGSIEAMPGPHGFSRTSV